MQQFEANILVVARTSMILLLELQMLKSFGIEDYFALKKRAVNLADLLIELFSSLFYTFKLYLVNVVH